MAYSTTSDPPDAASASGAPSDAELIARSATDPQAFDQLYVRHHHGVFRYVAARVGSANAEDLVAETFLAAYRSRERFQRSRGDDALPWLLGIATRRLGRHRDFERRWLRDRATPSGDDTPADMTREVDARIDAERLAPALARALGELSRSERDPLLLHVVGGLPYDEVALALALPIGTVRSRIARARTRLAGILDGAPR